MRTLLVDDSAAFLVALRQALAEDAAFEVVGEARDGERAHRLATALRPDLVVMDIHLPGLDGISTTARIMRDAPCPVVVVSAALDGRQPRIAFDALRAGAVEVLPKPRDLGSPATRAELRHTLRNMAQVKVVRRRITGGEAYVPEVQVVAIGSSTGGPPALVTVLSALPAGFSPTVMIAQHLAPGFSAGLAEWLASACALPVRCVSGRRPRERGCVYLPADGCHLVAEGDEVVALASGPEDRSVPGVNRLFRSLVPRAPAVVAAVLTGMGADGAAGLAELRQAGARTLAQDEASSLVWGMPRAAHEAGAAEELVALSDLGPRLVQLASAGRV